MRVVMFYHSLMSDWNNGNAHFLRGVAFDLMSRGHEVQVYEPQDGWSFHNLVSEHGHGPVEDFTKAYPGLTSSFYDLESFDLHGALDGADLVMVHEWSDHELVRRIGQARAQSSRFRLLFHDTHHRAVTDAKSMAAYDLSSYDGVLAFGGVIRDIYIDRGWAARAWTWHEAADIRVFNPVADCQKMGDLIWIGNWGDEERTAELHEFLLGPVEALGIRARVHGVRYPEKARAALAQAGIEYAGWLPNHEAPRAFGHYNVTVHVPRRPYARALPGIPTIRVFEALACGIPLVSAPWEDSEHLFTPGKDFLIAQNGEEMKRHLRDVLEDDKLAHDLRFHGLQTIRAKHTCAHRVDELLEICQELGIKVAVVHRPSIAPGKVA